MFLICICGGRLVKNQDANAGSKKGSSYAKQQKISVSAENGYDHISLAVDSVPEIMKKIKAYPVTPINDHWFSLPNGTKIELKLLSDWKMNEE